MTLNDIIEMQKKFDNHHASNFKWDQVITDDNIHILEYLLLCLVGEFGETSNLVKKVLRGDCALADVKDQLSEEIIDMFIYIIKLGYQLNINMEEKYLEKLYKNKTRFIKFELDREGRNE